MYQKVGTALTLPRTRATAHRLVLRWPRLLVAAWWGAHFAGLAIYASLRGKMDDVGFPVHGPEIETTIFGSLPTIWLQRHIFSLAPNTLEWAAVAVHVSWFVVPLLAAGFVTWRRPDRIGSFFRWGIALQALALLLFALFPMRPPWMASDDVTRIIALRVGGQIDDSNAIAAMPSLHVTFPLMISLWFFRERWKAPALIMLGYSVLLAFEVVFSGEHYVVDVIGAAVVAAAIALATRLDYRAAPRHLARMRPTIRFPRARPVTEPALEAITQAGRSERAQALIEFALVLPVILLFFLVLVDFGIAIDRRMVIEHALSEGVRDAAVSVNTSSIINTTVDQSQGILEPGDVAVCYQDIDGNGDPGDPGDKVHVKATYTYEFTAGGGEMMQAFGITPPSILMDPEYVTALQLKVDGATSC